MLQFINYLVRSKEVPHHRSMLNAAELRRLISQVTFVANPTSWRALLTLVPSVSSPIVKLSCGVGYSRAVDENWKKREIKTIINMGREDVARHSSNWISIKMESTTGTFVFFYPKCTVRLVIFRHKLPWNWWRCGECGVSYPNVSYQISHEDNDGIQGKYIPKLRTISMSDFALRTMIAQQLQTIMKLSFALRIDVQQSFVWLSNVVARWTYSIVLR